ncbi:hypothetical protein BIV25_38450 [Streptomyces sp. MUSC 14]|nr:hypothetical protein BIV25_38450 [Streptomyces sp. MUSC 14]
MTGTRVAAPWKGWIDSADRGEVREEPASTRLWTTREVKDAALRVRKCACRPAGNDCATPAIIACQAVGPICEEMGSPRALTAAVASGPRRGAPLQVGMSATNGAPSGPLAMIVCTLSSSGAEVSSGSSRVRTGSACDHG